MSFLDHPLISERYFFPRPGAPAGARRVRVDGAELACAERRCGRPGAPLLLHFHGNGEIVADYLPSEPSDAAAPGGIAGAFTAAGLDVFLAEYRGYGASTGTPQLGRMLDDVGAILEATSRRPEDVVVYGRSVGSLFAVEAIRRWPSARALVLESGIADPLERLLLRVRPDELGGSLAELADEVRARLDPEPALRAYEGPVLVLHARRDALVAARHAERNAANARRGALVLYDEGDHNTVLALHLADVVRRVAALAR